MSELNSGAKRRSIFNWINPFASGAGSMGRMVRLIFLVAVLYLVSTPFVCWYEYQRNFPAYFDVKAETLKALNIEKDPRQGTVFTTTMIVMGNRMLQSWLPNDVVYPAVFMDNPQNFQLGQLEVMRYCTRVLRDKLSRQRTTDKIDPFADKAFTELSNNPRLWIFPSFESKFAAGMAALADYRKGLMNDASHFYARADNLIELLEQLTSLLGGVNTRLSNAPRDWSVRLSEETAGDRYTEGEKIKRVHVPWREIDDNFYFARGVSYSVRQIMMAVQYEFRDILKMKRSEELLKNVVEELALANFEPLLVLNGSRDSVFANHSLKLMATLEDVRQKMINLQHMLER